LPNKQEKKQTVEEIKPSTSSSVSQLEAIDNIEEVEEEVVPVETKRRRLQKRIRLHSQHHRKSLKRGQLESSRLRCRKLSRKKKRTKVSFGFRPI